MNASGRKAYWPNFRRSFFHSDRSRHQPFHSFRREQCPIRDELRRRNYTPVLFDFEKPSSRDITETVSMMAQMARFVIADLTDAKNIPQELMAIVPMLPSVQVQPFPLKSQRECGMFEHFRGYPWVLAVFEYVGQDHVISSLKSNEIGPAETKVRQLNWALNGDSEIMSAEGLLPRSFLFFVLSQKGV